MFKKTLIAAAVSMVATAPAFADVDIVNENSWQITKIANVSKQSALDFSTAVEDVELRFDNGTVPADRELRNNGFLVIEINQESGATFNAPEVRQWLTTDAPNAASLDGLAVSTDLGGSESVVTSNALAELERFFQTTLDNGYTTIVHNLDKDGRRLRIALKNDVETAVFSDARVDINLSEGNNIFRLIEAYNTEVEDVLLTVGAQQNGSYTHDILETPVVFDQSAELYSLTRTKQGQATALVDTFFENYKLGLNNAASNHDGYDSIRPSYEGENTDIVGRFVIANETSNQNIQKGQVRLTMTGDFSGFQRNDQNFLLKADGTATEWKITSAGTARRLVDTVGTLQSPTQPSQVIESILYNFTPNDGTGTTGSTSGDNTGNNNDIRPGYGDVQNNGAINGGSYNITADIGQFNRETLEAEANQTDSYYPFDANLVDIIIVDRDGMKFDTITTGSSSANKIFIRDVSNRLGTSGGKILVTLVEYDKHGAHQGGKGTVRADRQLLKNVTLPSGGAVTLTPASVAADLGIQIAPGHQARFIFEVQTNQGEVAIKKSNSEGVDVKNGTRNVNQRDGDNGNLVDFTL
ncbi:S-layer protein [Oceanimonas sp. CHS3-5]|uniref:VapA family S-layer protein n=1 Tax=Oceanimonas sp. CHS3-5 TaxID=3068186 RepID=UPI00273F4644|nr:S-layer protein [Oceanimonas sp. CHS3-5]MDP5292531.1 S-layer protein [Oceanimonas sp. CHS3-5]